VQPRPDLIDAIFSAYRVRGSWEPLPSTGVANWIYATREVVLRVATDHRDAVRDARTESVAAPAAYAAGILTPRLLAFDDTRTIVDRPFSLWERIQGATLGTAVLADEARFAVWRSVGRELARLHRVVTVCPDPQGYLETPDGESDTDRLLVTLVDSQRLGEEAARDIADACRELQDASGPTQTAFTHGDVHRLNVMCHPSGRLLALIDWGDAGWGDPMLDFSSMPLDAIPPAVAGYQQEADRRLDAGSRARLVRAKVISGLEHYVRHPEREFDGEALRQFATKSPGAALDG
jgi:aminoglycoside phosphotransferase (APT) family kinase protein